jgi:pyruvate/2-oxoglutarate dehydrogenase complex dihydrolipoamide acyltransferase (E2) component
LQVLPIPAPGKRITEREVFAAAEALKARQEQISEVVRYPAQRESLSTSELERARAWSYSQHCIPQLTLETVLPCAGVHAALKKQGASASAQGPEFVDLLLRAVAQALCEETFRAFRAIIDGGDRVLRGSIDVGLSLPSLPDDGRMVFKAADRLSLTALVQQRRELSRAGALINADASTPLISLVYYGGAGIFSGNERVWPGESAALAVYDAQPQPILRPGRSLEIQPAWKLALTVDRRLIDRSKAAEFLQFLMRRFEQMHCLL